MMEQDRPSDRHAGMAAVPPADGNGAEKHHVAIPGPLGLTDLLDRAFRLLQRNPWPLILTGAILLVPYSLIDVVRTSLVGSNGWGLVQSERFFSAANVMALMSVLLYGLLTALVTLAVSHQCIELVHGRTLSTGEGVRRGLGQLWAYIRLLFTQLGVVVLLALMAAAPGLIIAATAVAGGGFEWIMLVAMLGLPIGIGLLGLSLLLLCFCFTRWLVAVPSMVAERLGPLSALRRSWHLTYRHEGRSLIYLVLLGIIGLLISRLPGLLLERLTLLLLGPDGRLLAAGLASAGGRIMDILTLSLQAAATVLLYYDLRVRREGYDLMLRVARMESEAGQRSPAEPVGETGA